MRLPAWGGRSQREPQAHGRPKRAPADAAAPASLPPPSDGGAIGNDAADRRSADRPWPAQASAPRPGFPVQRSPAVSPQKPSAASAISPEGHEKLSSTALSAGADYAHSPADGHGSATGATNLQTEPRQQQQHIAPRQHLAPTPQTRAEVEGRVPSCGEAFGDAVGPAAATARSAIPQPADSPPARACSAAEQAGAPEEAPVMLAAGQPVQPATLIDEHEHNPSGAELQHTEGLKAIRSNLQPSLDTRSAKAAPAVPWDGNDAALLAVIVEHAKVLRTINAGEAGSSCSIM